MADLMSMEEVAAETGIPITTLRYYRANSAGPKSFKLGRRVKYMREDVELWIRAQYEAPDKPRSVA